MPIDNDNGKINTPVHDDDEPTATYASPPCFMHELSPEYAMEMSGSKSADDDVKRWRKSERQRLIEMRLAIDADERAGFSDEIAKRLNLLLSDIKGAIISTYWPFRGEPDLRPWMEQVVARGGQCALPLVVKSGHPLIFRCWKHGDPLERGVWNIPVPAAGPEVVPDIVIAPVVGFDQDCFRLGYGGGFFDRTLAGLSVKPKVVGVGYSSAEINTIYPQPHDIAMDTIVTEARSIS